MTYSSLYVLCTLCTSQCLDGNIQFQPSWVKSRGQGTKQNEEMCNFLSLNMSIVQCISNVLQTVETLAKLRSLTHISSKSLFINIFYWCDSLLVRSDILLDFLFWSLCFPQGLPLQHPHVQLVRWVLTDWGLFLQSMSVCKVYSLHTTVSYFPPVNITGQKTWSHT